MRISAFIVALSMLIAGCSPSTPSRSVATQTQLALIRKNPTALSTATIQASMPIDRDIPDKAAQTRVLQTASANLPDIGDKQLHDVPLYGMEFVPADDLDVIQGMGIDVVLAVFPHDGLVQDWVAYLDQAYALEIKVIGRLWPEGWQWDGSNWQIDSQTRIFIQTLANHPATLAVYALEEPYWRGCWGCGYTTDQLQLLYKRIREIARIPIYSEVDSMSFWTEQGENTAFADGICDYCASWYYPFLADGSYQREELISNLTADLAVARSRAPNSKFIWLMQGFAQERTFRLPAAEEMYDLAAIVYDLHVDGALWYCWNFGSLYSDFLSKHPELEPVIREIHRNIVIPKE